MRRTSLSDWLNAFGLPLDDGRKLQQEVTAKVGILVWAARQKESISTLRAR